MLRKPSAIVWCIVLLTIGASSALLLPPNPATIKELHISVGVYKASALTLILPYAIIWFTAFYAFEKLNNYANKVRKTREGKAFKQIAIGVGVLAWGLAIPTILSLILGAIVAGHPTFSPYRTLFNSYLAMIISVCSYYFISTGTRELDDIVKVRPSNSAVRMMIFLFSLIGAGFVSVVIHAQDVGKNPFHMPMMLLILTLVVPHMFAWFIGLYSVFELLLYLQTSSGVIYKKALSTFTKGYALVVIASITVQYLTGSYINRTSLALGSVLILVYILLSIEVGGYALLALAAKRLMRLEEV